MRLASLVLGTILLAVGLFSLLGGTLSFRHRKNLINAGPVHVSRDATSHLAIGPVAGVLSILAGCGLVISGLRSR